MDHKTFFIHVAIDRIYYRYIPSVIDFLFGSIVLYVNKSQHKILLSSHSILGSLLGSLCYTSYVSIIATQ